MPDRRIQAAVECQGLFAAVGDHFNLAHDNIRAFGGVVHLGLEGQFKLADTFGFNGELRRANAAGVYSESLV